MKNFVCVKDYSTEYYFQKELTAEEACLELWNLFEKYYDTYYKRVMIIAGIDDIDISSLDKNDFIVKGVRINTEECEEKEKEFIDYVNKNISPVTDLYEAHKALKDRRKHKRKDFQEAFNLQFEYRLCEYKYIIDEENPNRYFIFNRDIISNHFDLSKIYKRHKSTYSSNFLKKFDEWFEIFMLSLKDLTDKKIYSFYSYPNNTINNDTWKVYKAEKTLYDFKFYEAFYSYDRNKVCTVIPLPDDMEDSELVTKEYNKNLGEKLIKAVSTIYNVDVDNLTVEISFPEGKEIYSKERFFEELAQDAELKTKPHIVKAYIESLNRIKGD